MPRALQSLGQPPLCASHFPPQARPRLRRFRGVAPAGHSRGDGGSGPSAIIGTTGSGALDHDPEKAVSLEPKRNDSCPIDPVTRRRPLSAALLPSHAPSPSPQLSCRAGLYYSSAEENVLHRRLVSHKEKPNCQASRYPLRYASGSLVRTRQAPRRNGREDGCAVRGIAPGRVSDQMSRSSALVPSGRSMGKASSSSSS